MASREVLAPPAPTSRNGRAMADARERILAGERINEGMLRKKHGGASNVLSVVARRMSAEGYRLIRETEPAPQGGLFSFWRIAHDDEQAFDPNTRLRLPRGQNKKKVNRVTAPRETVPVKAKVVPPPPAQPERPMVPVLGSTLTVRFLMQDDDGTVKVGLANGKHVWGVVVESVTER